MTTVFCYGGSAATILAILCILFAALTGQVATTNPPMWSDGATTALELEVLTIITLDRTHAELRHAEAEIVRKCTEDPSIPQYQILVKKTKRLNTCITPDLQIGLRPIIQVGGPHQWAEVTAYWKEVKLGEIIVKGWDGLLLYLSTNKLDLIQRFWDSAKQEFVEYFIRDGIRYWRMLDAVTGRWYDKPVEW